MADILHELKIKAAPEKVFAALTTSQGLQSWHTPRVSGDGSLGQSWRFEFAGRPAFQWQVTASTSPSHVGWKCTAGPGDSVGTQVDFRLSPAGDGRTLVELVHGGWPATDGNFRKCNTYWGVLLHHLRQYVETGAAQPAFE